MCDVQEGAMAPADGLPGKRRQDYPQYTGAPMTNGMRENTRNSGHMINGPHRGPPPPPQAFNQGYGNPDLARGRFNPAEGQYPLQNSSGREGKRPIMTREPPPKVIHQNGHYPTPRGPHPESNSRIEFRRASAQAEPPSAQPPAPPAIVNNSQAVMPQETPKVQNSGAQETQNAGHEHPKPADFDFNHKTLEIVIPVQGHGSYSSFIQGKNGRVHVTGDFIKSLIKDELGNKRNIKDFGRENFEIDLRNTFVVKAEVGAVDNKYLKPFYPSIYLGENPTESDPSTYFFNKKKLTTSDGRSPRSVPYAFRIPAEHTCNKKILIREREGYANDPYVLRHHGETPNKLKEYLDYNSSNTLKYGRIGVDVSTILYAFVSNESNINWCQRAFAEQGVKCISDAIFDTNNGVTYAYYDPNFLSKAIHTYEESRNMILSVKDLTGGVLVKFNTFSMGTLVPTYDVIDCKTSVQEGTLENSRGVVYFELHLTVRIPLISKLGQITQEIETAGQKFMRCINSSGKFFDDDVNQTS